MSPVSKVKKIEDEPSGGEMSFVDHIEQLRWHIVRSCLAILIFGVTAFCFKDFIFNTLIFGPLNNTFPTYRVSCWLSEHLFHNNSICFHINRDHFIIINTEMAGQFMMHMQVAMSCGFILAFPVVAWEIWRFVKPGLTRKEVKYTRGLVFFMSSLFFTGVFFGYFLLVPTALQFFTSYEISPEVHNNFDLDNYVSFASSFVISAGIVFELPVAVYFLSKLGLLSPGFMRRNRRYAVVILLILAACISPTPDWFTMMVVFLPLYGLYELSIFVSANVERDRNKKGMA